MRLAKVLLGLVMWACGSSAVRDAALRDDLPTLKRAIAEARERGELDERTVRGVARAVIERELFSSVGDVAVARVRDVRTCIGPVEGVLDDLSERRDAGGGAAKLALLESGRARDSDLVSLYENDADAAWRAVGARAAIGVEHGKTRRRLMVDPDLRVRRSALYAARQEPRREDRELLMEAARLDPDPLVRSVAVQTLGAIGGEEVVKGLIDLWSVSDLETRQMIVEAWANESSYDSGGEARLLSTMETQQGLAVLVAARGLIANQSQHSAHAARVLARIAESGPSDERRLALTWLPLDEVGMPVVKQAMQDGDHSVSVVAATRLLGREQGRAKALSVLKRLASGRHRGARSAAQRTLAGAGERSVMAALRALLDSQDAAERRHAALSLLELGEYSAAAQGLGDDVASVRTQVACAVLAQR